MYLFLLFFVVILGFVFPFICPYTHSKEHLKPKPAFLGFKFIHASDYIIFKLLFGLLLFHSIQFFSPAFFALLFCYLSIHGSRALSIGRNFKAIYWLVKNNTRWCVHINALDHDINSLFISVILGSPPIFFFFWYPGQPTHLVKHNGPIELLD